jgi:hypothetical protein
MGFFSWKTQDTDRSICNVYSDREPFKVVLHDNKGNKWIENAYEGYGRFGGKDYYKLLAEMNGGGTREDGIEIEFPEGWNNLEFKPDPNIQWPNLTEDPDWEWVNEQPKGCEYQGFFY